MIVKSAPVSTLIINVLISQFQMAKYMNIYSIEDLKKYLRRCREITIYRPQLNYYHHIFVGDVNEFGCNLYHYKGNIASFWFRPPAQIKKERLVFASYNDDIEEKKIFDFNKGDKVYIVNRNDYPKIEDEEDCIQRAESRLGEKTYSVAFNNCESFVNWIFSGDNTSTQYINASILTKACLILMDECICMGMFRICLLLFLSCCALYLKLILPSKYTSNN